MREAAAFQGAEADTGLAERVDRPVLLSMSTRKEHSLYPRVSYNSGWRLWKLLNDRMPEVSIRDFTTAFEIHNLMRRKWDPLEARQTALRLQSALVGRTVVVLGNDARFVLKLPKLLLVPQIINGVTWRQIPHPKGLDKFYDDPVQSMLVGMLLEGLYQEWRKRQDAYVQRSQRLSGATRDNLTSA